MRKLLILGMVLFAGQLAADETHGWAVVYEQKVVNPTVETLMICTDNRPDCNTVYMNQETTRWFPTKELALDFLNGFTFMGSPVSKTYLNSGETVPPNPMDKANVIGLYRCERVTLSLNQTGTHKATVKHEVTEDVPTMEWQ